VPARRLAGETEVTDLRENVETDISDEHDLPVHGAEVKLNVRHRHRYFRERDRTARRRIDSGGITAML
jgi:hypothetical protein